MTNVLDKIGIWTTSLCAVHCLLMPLLLPVVPLIAASFFAEHWFERAVLIVSIVIGFFALFVGYYRYHKKLYPIYGVALGGFIYWNKDAFGHDFEPLAVTVGAIFVVTAHLINLRLCKSCKDCESEQTA